MPSRLGLIAPTGALLALLGGCAAGDDLLGDSTDIFTGRRQAEIDAAVLEVERERQRGGTLETRRETLEAEQEQLDRQLAGERARSDELRRRLATLDRDIEAKSRESVRLQEQERALRARIAEIEAERETLLRQLGPQSPAAELAEHKRRLRDLEDEYAELLALFQATL